MYIVWKKIPRHQGYIKILHFIYYNNIILYISDNTYVLLIPPMNPTHTTLKNSGTELISTVGSLHICPFILHTSPFQPVVQGGIAYRKKPQSAILAFEKKPTKNTILENRSNYFPN
jgi:hypothetical protein